MNRNVGSRSGLEIVRNRKIEPDAMIERACYAGALRRRRAKVVGHVPCVEDIKQILLGEK